MVSGLEVRDFDNELLIQARESRSLLGRILAGLVPGAFVIIAIHPFLAPSAVLPIAALAAGLGIVHAMKERRNELRVTKLEFAARGHFGDGLQATRHINSADIRWLEYQENTTGPETSHHPEGLYAVAAYRSICIFPNLNESQTESVIERIMQKFPDLKDQFQHQSAFGHNFISLGLQIPRPR